MIWTYNNEPLIEIPEGFVGFVYLIEDLTNEKLYIGKKLFRFRKTKQVKGKKKRTLVSSDWLEYYGSNKELQEQVEKHGPERFRRTILHLCKTKGECSYLEAKEIINRDAIPSILYYNQWLSCKISRSHLPK
jgi:hypothetical protein